MVFSSAIFIFAFLPCFLLVYYLSPAAHRSLVITAGGFVFYGWWRIDFLLLLAALTLGNYLCGKNIVRLGETYAARRWMQGGIIANLLVLGAFKYFNFGMDNLNAVLDRAGLNSFHALRFILPLGISFHIFQCISFLVDLHRGACRMPRNFIDFAAFIALFPQLIAGPVIRYKYIAAQIENRIHDFDKFSEGARRFMIGFAKKILIADMVAPLADGSFALENPHMTDAWIGLLAYTVQLYYDFSGYSDMAIGLALMMGFKFPENFHRPYASASVSEFWRRWHITLSDWLRDYLYIPLGGNRKGRARTLINIFVTMLLGGLWHGANWTFILWGAWHGGWMALERARGIDGKTASALRIPAQGIAVIITIFLVMMGWVLFRAENIGFALDMYKGLFGVNGYSLHEAYVWQMKGLSLTALLVGSFALFIGPWLPASAKINMTPFITIPLFLLAVSRLLAQSTTPFLYFQF